MGGTVSKILLYQKHWGSPYLEGNLSILYLSFRLSDFNCVFLWVILGYSRIIRPPTPLRQLKVSILTLPAMFFCHPPSFMSPVCFYLLSFRDFVKLSIEYFICLEHSSINPSIYSNLYFMSTYYVPIMMLVVPPGTFSLVGRQVWKHFNK